MLLDLKLCIISYFFCFVNFLLVCVCLTLSMPFKDKLSSLAQPIMSCTDSIWNFIMTGL